MREIPRDWSVPGRWSNSPITDSFHLLWTSDLALLMQLSSTFSESVCKFSRARLNLNSELNVSCLASDRCGDGVRGAEAGAWSPRMSRMFQTCSMNSMS